VLVGDITTQHCFFRMTLTTCTLQSIWRRHEVTSPPRRGLGRVYLYAQGALPGGGADLGPPHQDDARVGGHEEAAEHVRKRCWHGILHVYSVLEVRTQAPIQNGFTNSHRLFFLCGLAHTVLMLVLVLCLQAQFPMACPNVNVILFWGHDTSPAVVCRGRRPCDGPAIVDLLGPWCLRAPRVYYRSAGRLSNSSRCVRQTYDVVLARRSCVDTYLRLVPAGR
jgi:hypothetical protein